MKGLLEKKPEFRYNTRKVFEHEFVQNAVANL